MGTYYVCNLGLNNPILKYLRYLQNTKLKSEESTLGIYRSTVTLADAHKNASTLGEIEKMLATKAGADISGTTTDQMAFLLEGKGENPGYADGDFAKWLILVTMASPGHHTLIEILSPQLGWERRWGRGPGGLNRGIEYVVGDYTSISKNKRR